MRKKKLKSKGLPKLRARVKTKNDVSLPDYESDLISRISDCERVVGELDTSPVWGIIQADLQLQRQNIDDRWQEITDPIRVLEARVIKYATMHILNLKVKYNDELEGLRKELDKARNIDKEIVKDYDSE